MSDLSDIRKGFLPMYQDLKTDIELIRKQVTSGNTYLSEEISKQVDALDKKIESIDPVDYKAISTEIEGIKKSIPAPVVKTEKADVSHLVSKSDFLKGLIRLETKIDAMEKAGKQDPIMEVAITNLEQLKDALESNHKPGGTQTVVNSQRYPFTAGGAQAALALVETPGGAYAMPVANIDGTPIADGSGGGTTLSGVVPVTVGNVVTISGAVSANITNVVTTSGITSTPIYDIKNISPDNDPQILTYKYYGSVRRGGTDWRIMRKTVATKSFDYATGATNYATAWTTKSGLAYT